MSVINLYNEINSLVEEARLEVEDETLIIMLERAKRRILRPKQLLVLKEPIGTQVSIRVLGALRQEFGPEKIQFLGDVFYVLLGEHRHITMFGKKGLMEVKNLFKQKGIDLDDSSNTEDDGLRSSFLLWKKEGAG